jgi:hypothetical protein
MFDNRHPTKPTWNTAMRGLKVVTLTAVPILLAASVYGYRLVAPGRAVAIPDHPVLRLPPTLDLGDRELGSVFVPRFTLTNAGRRELVIDDIRSSCACTGLEREMDGRHVRIESLRVAPGESAELVMRVAIRGRIGEPTRNQIRFRTNDPNQPEASIEVVVAHVTGGIVAVPSNLAFGTLVLGQENRQLLEIRDNAGHCRSITRVVSSAPSRFSVRLLSAKEIARRSIQEDRFANLIGLLEVTVPAGELGTIDGEVLVYLDEPERPPDRVSVSARVANLVEAFPSVLTLPRSSGSGPLFSGNCIVRANSAESESMVLRVDSLPSGIEVEFEPNKLESRSQLVRIEWRGNTAALEAEEVRHLRLKATVGARECLVEIPVRIRPGKG